MIRQRQKKAILTKLGMVRVEEPLILQGKNIMSNPGGQNLRPSSKNGWNSQAAGLHLSPGCGLEVKAAQLFEAGMPPEEGSTQSDPSPRERLRECENLPPARRPLKLAPLPQEVKEAQRRKINGIQQEVTASTRQLDALGNELHPRRAGNEAIIRLLRSPECPSRRLSRMPVEREGPRPVKAQVPVTEVRPFGLQRLALVEQPRGHTALPSKFSLPATQSTKTKIERAEEGAMGNPGTCPDAGRRRRLRLRRAQCVDEDQSKLSVSLMSGLSTDEGKGGLAGKQKGGQSTNKAL